MHNNSQGFTLIELLTVLTIAAILLVVAVPSFLSIIQNNKVVAATNRLAASLSFARMEALRSGQKVSVCPAATSASTSCGTNAQWAQGWLVFADADANNAVDSTNNLLNTSNNVSSGITITSAASVISYDGTGFLLNGTTTISINASGCTGNNARTISISTSGRISVAAASCS